MQLCLCQKVKVTMFSQNQFLSVLLIILASFPFSFSSDLGNPLVVLDLHRHHRTRRLQSTSAKNVTVNVDHFGAKGDGGDDTQVTQLYEESRSRNNPRALLKKIISLFSSFNDAIRSHC